MNHPLPMPFICHWEGKNNILFKINNLSIDGIYSGTVIKSLSPWWEIGENIAIRKLDIDTGALIIDINYNFLKLQKLRKIGL